MSKRMLIDATHDEETRVAVVDGNRLVEFDYESKVRKQIKGNIFLAKVTRVEPSLQAAFVNFGGNRHGFLPFSEIHPDYYRIPIADRERLIAEQAEEISALKQEEEEEFQAAAAATEAEFEDSEDDEEDLIEEIGGKHPDDLEADADHESLEQATDSENVEGTEEDTGDEEARSERFEDPDQDADEISGNVREPEEDEEDSDYLPGNTIEPEGGESKDNFRGEQRDRSGRSNRHKRFKGNHHGKGRRHVPHRSRRVEVVGGEDFDGDHPRRFNYKRHYKIQEVVKRGQIMLVQVSKEERGNKGAAVTTYLSLPGRYCVLMPNSPHAGGISRKIANFKDRRYMKEILGDLDAPEGMSVILRTAGVERSKAEIKRDFDYLLRLWDDIRELTLKSTAPALINEEGNLVKRAIRDIYTRDIEEVIVSGAESYKNAKKFMKLLIPSHARKVKEYKDERLPLFQRYQVETQINDIADPSVTLKSGGYIVINPTEALVSIDVNSGKATKERHIEETALKTNLEAADEVARQLRLRDLGGLVVIDFIDMEDRRNNAKVERRIKEALSRDRARIQIGRISSFGLMELSRQRMNPSLTESQFHRCPHCQGVGFIRTLDGTAISALRAVEEIGTYGRHAEVTLKVSNEVALYILNNKRSMLATLEQRYDFRVVISIDNSVLPGSFTVEPGALRHDDHPAEEPAEQEPAEESHKAPREREEGEEDESRESRKSSRRRGRRGGRRRNRPDSGFPRSEDNDENTVMQAGESETEGDSLEEDIAAEEVSNSDDGEAVISEEGAASTPQKSRDKKPGRRQHGRKNDDKNIRAKGSSERQRRPARDEEREAAIDLPDQARTDEPAAPETAEQAAATTQVIEPLTRVAASKPQRSANYEVVSQAPEQKKKGWWNKLID